MQYRETDGPISRLVKLEHLHCLGFYRDCFTYTVRVESRICGQEIWLDDGPQDVFVTCRESENNPCVLHEHGQKECYQSRYRGSSSGLNTAKDARTLPWSASKDHTYLQMLSNLNSELALNPAIFTLQGQRISWVARHPYEICSPKSLLNGVKSGVASHFKLVIKSGGKNRQDGINPQLGVP